MCAQQRMSDWIKILRIAGEVEAAHIEAQTIHILNSTVPLRDDECRHLAAELQAEIERKQAVLAQTWEGVREVLAVAADLRLQQGDELARLQERSGEAAVLAEVERLSRLSDELRVMVKSPAGRSLNPLSA